MDTEVKFFHGGCNETPCKWPLRKWNRRNGHGLIRRWTHRDIRNTRGLTSDGGGSLAKFLIIVNMRCYILSLQLLRMVL